MLNTTNYRQEIDMMGGDMERSSFAVQGAQNTEQIIQWGFGDIKFDVCRVQYDKHQELEEGVKNLAYYDDQIQSMKDIQSINPDIKFFGTLKSDYDGYGNDNNLPDWFCNYETRVVDTDKYGIFLADYVEYMSQQGVPVSYLSVAKEWQAYFPADVADDVIIKLKSELYARDIAMPLISDQGHWGLPACINYVDDVAELETEDLYHSFCNHNYSNQDTAQWRSLVLKAAALGKSVYNDESRHGGGNPTSGAELDISIPLAAYAEKSSMYEAGAKGELFFEIWSRNKNGETRPIYFPSGGTGVRMRAYYIMKHFANHAADSTYLTSRADALPEVHTMAFRVDDQIALWVINEGSNTYSNVPVLADASKMDEIVDAVVWTDSTSITGSNTSYTVSDNSFSASIEALSINCYLIDVKSDMDNLAFNGTATQSSTAFTAAASRAIDNDTLGVWSEGSVTHTDTEDQPWWQLDLGEEYSINFVQLFNRIDSEGAKIRLSDYDVTIFDEDDNVVWTTYLSEHPDPQVTLDAGGAIGRYVKVQLRGTNPIHLAEVRVLGVATAPVAEDQDVALDMNDSVAITLTASSVLGLELSYSVDHVPAHGTLSGTPPDLIYTPNADFWSVDSFTFVADDGADVSQPATVSILVKSPEMYWTASSAPQSGGLLSSGLFNTNGTLLYAENTGGPELTFDGITFVAGMDGSSSVLGVNSPNYSSYHSGTQISSSGLYPDVANVTPTLSGLTIGETYRVQLLFFDYRSGQAGSRIFVDDTDMGQYANGASGAGILASLVFVAEDTELSFKVERTTSDGVTIWDQVQLNAVAVHRLDAEDPFTAWLASYGLTGTDALPETDVESDGYNNLAEYALGGNPTNDDAALLGPQISVTNIFGESFFYLVYKQNCDSSLTFSVGATEDLMLPATNPIVFVGETAESGGFKTVTNRTTVSAPATFIQLKVER
ncbi:discoidin domain-containing protein [Pontiellaceae bacterium B12219]|nr:discoidin domain-containing protein [Pontiellaceae bacterium B12219]